MSLHTEVVGGRAILPQQVPGSCSLQRQRVLCSRGTLLPTPFVPTMSQGECWFSPLQMRDPAVKTK